MLKNLVIVGGLLAVGPLVAGCMTNSSISAMRLKSLHIDTLCRYIKDKGFFHSENIWDLENELKRRDQNCIKNRQTQSLLAANVPGKARDAAQIEDEKFVKKKLAEA